LILADYLEAIDVKDAIVDAMIEKVLNNPPGCPLRHEMHQTIYPASQPESLIRQLFADIVAHTWTASFVKARANEPQWSDFLSGHSCGPVFDKREINPSLQNRPLLLP
jgi:hypothetical protein